MGFGAAARDQRGPRRPRRRVSPRTATPTWKSSACVLDGALAHKDSAGGGGVIRAGDVQWMSAGHGVEHSEFNGSDDRAGAFPADLDPARPRLNHAPAYDAAALRSRTHADGRWVLLASPDGADGSIGDPPGRAAARHAAAAGRRAGARRWTRRAATGCTWRSGEIAVGERVLRRRRRAGASSTKAVPLALRGIGARQRRAAVRPAALTRARRSRDSGLADAR